MKSRAEADAPSGRRSRPVAASSALSAFCSSGRFGPFCPFRHNSLGEKLQQPEAEVQVLKGTWNDGRSVGWIGLFLMCRCHPAKKKKKKKLPAEKEAAAAAGKMIEEEMSIVVINLVSFFGVHSLTPPQPAA